MREYEPITITAVYYESNLIAKTYLILFIGFILTLLGTWIGLEFAPKLLSMEKTEFLLISLGITAGTMFLATITQQTLLGYLFFGAFTFFIGFFNTPVVTIMLKDPALSQIIQQAFLITAGITGATTLYVSISKKDFSFLGGFLFVGLIGIIIMAVIGLFWNNDLMQSAIAGIGAILFSLFILFDTSRLIHKKGTPIEIAIALFMDIINLFWMIVKILILSRR